MVTRHAKRRLKQRTGVNGSQVNKIVSRALNEGIRHSQAKGRLKEWMDAEYLKYQTANNCRYYAHKLYIFHNHILITVLDADDWFDNSLRDYVIDDKVYIEYRKKRYSRRKDPSEEKQKLADDLNRFIPQEIEEKFECLEIPAHLVNVKVLKDFTIEVSYKPNGLVKMSYFEELQEFAKGKYGLNIRVKAIYDVMLSVPVLCAE